MFSQLSDQLQQTFKNLRGHGRLSESNISDALREVRLALLDADVHFAVAKEFIARVKDRAMGEEVLKSVTPGQQIVKIFHNELTALLGGDNAPLNYGKPTRILIVGLNGAGKTTSSAKLARLLKNPGLFSSMKGETERTPMLIALDLVPNPPKRMSLPPPGGRSFGVKRRGEMSKSTIPQADVKSMTHLCRSLCG